MSKNKETRNWHIYNLSATALLELGEFTALASVAYNKDRSKFPTAINLTRASGLAFGAGGNICDYTNAIGLGDLGCDTQGVVRQATENFRLANTSIPFESFFEGWAASLEMNGKLGDFNVTAITGFRKSNDQLLEENTGTPPASYTGVPGAGVPLFGAAPTMMNRAQQAISRALPSAWRMVTASSCASPCNVSISVS